MFDAKRYPAAYYIAGYSVECAIKACIANQTKQYEFPDKARATDAFQHKFSDLIKSVRALDVAHKHDIGANAQFAARWAVVSRWSVDSRYDLGIDRKDAKDMIEAVTDVPDGVLEWFRSHWHL